MLKYILPFLLFVSTFSQKVMIIGSDSISFSSDCCDGCCSSKILNPILDLAFPNTTFIWTNKQEPDLVIRSPFRNPTRENYTCPYINFSGEPYQIEHKSYPPILELNAYINYTAQLEQNGTITNFYVPHIINANYNLSNIRKYTHLDRPYLIAYMNSNCRPNREYLFKLLVNMFGSKNVHALGKCSNNRKINDTGHWIYAPDIYKDYTFTFAMENSDLFGYVSEKIMNSFISGSIPLYFGSQGKITDFFNHKSFINVNNFNSLNDCANYIYKLVHNKKELYKIQTEPIFTNNVIPELLSLKSEWVKTIAYHLRKNYDSFKH
jgi:hypothetical protein